MVLSALIWSGLGFASAQAVGFQQYDFGNVGGWKPLHSWCDTTSRVLATTRPTTNLNKDVQPIVLSEWVGAKQTNSNYQLGPSDGGAGHIATALTPANKPITDPAPYYIYSSNVENTIDPEYHINHINEYVVPAGIFACRYDPKATVIAATSQYSLMVKQTNLGWQYTSLNRDGSKGVTLERGKYQVLPQGLYQWRWENAGFSYVLQAGAAGHPVGLLKVYKGNQLKANFSFLAYTISVAK